MKNLKTTLFFMFLTLLPFFSIAQCRELTEQKAVPLLGDYIISGRYHSLKLSEGEEILIFKTINRDINYRFIVIGAEELPEDIEMKITDWKDNHIYKKKNKEYSNIFYFENDKTQRIKIYIRIPDAKKSDEPKKGCVGLVIGFKTN